MVRACLTTVLMLAFAVGCPARKKNDFATDVIAMVNGETLSRRDFGHELSRELEALGVDPAPTPEQVEPLKKALLQNVVERTLLLQAAKAANLAATPEEVDREVLRIGADFPSEGFNEALNEGQLSMAELKQKTAALLTIEKLFTENVYPRVGVTEEEIHTYFTEHTAEFLEPEEVRAAQIVVKGLDEAKRLQVQLRAGKKFADLARKYSLSADAKVGGDLGYFPRGVMPPEFDEVAFRLAPNQTSDVVTSAYGFHLFKILDKRPAHRRGFAQVRAEVEKRLVTTKRGQAQTDYVQALKDKAQVQINEPALQALTQEVLKAP